LGTAVTSGAPATDGATADGGAADGAADDKAGPTATAEDDDGASPEARDERSRAVRSDPLRFTPPLPPPALPTALPAALPAAFPAALPVALPAACWELRTGATLESGAPAMMELGGTAAGGGGGVGATTVATAFDAGVGATTITGPAALLAALESHAAVAGAAAPDEAKWRPPKKRLRSSSAVSAS